MSEHKGEGQEGHHSTGVLRLIGVFKLLKSFFLILAAGATLQLMRHDMGERLIQWERSFHIAPAHRLIESAVFKILSINPRGLIALAVVLAVYATLYLIEGIGLLMLRHWAEWMTVITTGGFIPLEIYEMIHRPGAGKIAALVINILVLIYLIVRLSKDRREHAGQAGSPQMA